MAEHIQYQYHGAVIHYRLKWLMYVAFLGPIYYIENCNRYHIITCMFKIPLSIYLSIYLSIISYMIYIGTSTN